MIYSFIHPGSGAGNQLHRFIAGKILALDKGYEYSAIGREYFKCDSFMNLDFGETPLFPYDVERGTGKLYPLIPITQWNEETKYYNPEFNFVEDKTIIDGEFQSIQYFGHRLFEIDGWLETVPLDIPNDVCVIGFRGGEYYLYPELGLPITYFAEAIQKMKSINPKMKFEVHTDDPILAKKFFPDYKIIRDIGINWRSMRFAKYAIIANSSFYILPRLLNGGYTIAPRYWARYNTKEWSRPDNYYPLFKYI